MEEHPDHEYVYTITGQYKTRGDLVYAELRELWDNRVMEALLPSGEKAYFNKAIGAVKFIPPMVTKLRKAFEQKDN